MAGRATACTANAVATTIASRAPIAKMGSRVTTVADNASAWASQPMIVFGSTRLTLRNFATRRNASTGTPSIPPSSGPSSGSGKWTGYRYVECAACAHGWQVAYYAQESVGVTSGRCAPQPPIQIGGPAGRSAVMPSPVGMPSDGDLSCERSGRGRHGTCRPWRTARSPRRADRSPGSRDSMRSRTGGARPGSIRTQRA